MPRSIRYFLISLRDLLVSTGPFLLVGVGLLWLAYAWLNPTPPKRITLATGPAQSAYAEFGLQYQEALAANGIEVVLLPGQGSSANLEMLQNGQADLGFVQGGSAQTDLKSRAALQSLGSLFVEPIWIFYREAAARKLGVTGNLTSLTQMRHMRVNVGTAGSGVPHLMAALLNVNAMAADALHLTQLEQTPATVAFLGADLDALVFASAPESPMVQMLLQTPGVRLLAFAQNEAYSRRLPFLTPVVLPQGVVDLARNLPAQNVPLIATTTALLAGPDVHPAILQLLSQATLKLHGNAGWFSGPREFPKPQSTEFPLAPEAERTLRSGVPTLQRYLPFSWANLVERMWLALGIILAILLPLGKIAPPLYAFRVRSRVFRWYGQLRDLEDRWEELGHTSGQRDRSQTKVLVKELDHMERHVEKVIVPLIYADELYALRNHIELVRQRMLRE
jgi:TRAP-type uncharacterized transport system substrate-binding protein